MTITISSFTSNPSPADVYVGDDVQFTVVASEAGGATLSYEWEVRGATTGTWVGISGAISDTYTATNLQLTDNGNRYRVKVSESADPTNFQYSNDIQVSVTAQPNILILSEPTEDEYVVSSGDTLSLTVRGRVANIDRTDASQVSLLTFTWEEADDTVRPLVWTPVVLGSSVQQSDTLVEDSSVTPSVYDKESTLTFTNIAPSQDQTRYRAKLEYPLADNTPLYSNSTASPEGVKLVVNPSITLIANTTATPDTLVSYNTAISGSGETTLTVSATTTAAASVLSYQWQYTVDNVNYIDILTTGESNLRNFTVPGGASVNSSTLPLIQVRYYPVIGFRCRINGSLGENEVTTATEYLTITQSVDPNQIVNFTDVDIIEDRYGDIVDRSAYSSAIRRAQFSGSADIDLDTGLHGDTITVVVERQNPTSQTITGTTLTSVSDGGTTLTTGTNADISMIGNDPLGNTYAGAENKNPSVAWDFNTSSFPAGVTVSSYSVLLEDLSAIDPLTSNPYLHWSVTNIPNTTTSISADASAITGATINNNYIGAPSSSGVSAVGYSGPQPPTTENHVYRLSVSANLSGAVTTKLTQSIEFNFDTAQGPAISTNPATEPDNLTITTSAATWSTVATFTGGELNYDNPGRSLRFFYSYDTVPVRITSDNGAKFRQIVSVSNPTTGATNPITLTEATLNVYPTAFIDSNPASVNVFEGETASFSVGASSSSGQTLIYQWQRSASGVTWSNVSDGTVTGAFAYSGSNTNTLVITGVPSAIGFPLYRCVVDVAGSLSSVTSTAAAVSVSTDNFVFISNLNNINVAELSPFSFTASATSESGGPVTFQWQRSASSAGPFVDIAGEVNNSYGVLSATAADAGFYRCQVTSASGSVDNTNAAEVNVILNVVNVTNIRVPTTITFTENVANQLTFEVDASATNGSIITYQWQFFNTGTGSWESLGLGFNNMVSTNKTYAFGPLDKPTFDGYQIRCLCTATDTGTTATSSVCTISIRRTLTYNALPESFDVVDGGSFEWNLQPVLTGGTATFQWQINTTSTPLGGGWTDITTAGTNPTYDGFNTSSLRVTDIPNTLSSAYFRCVITAPLVDEYIFNRTPAPSPIPTGGNTVFSQMFVSPVLVLPNYYTEFRERTGAAIGTVICVPKIFGYTAPTSDLDSEQFGVCSAHGFPEYPVIDALNAVTGSTEISYNTPRPSDVSRAFDPIDGPYSAADLHPGFIEMTGQFLRCVDFPELARILGDRYGGNITGTYPNYSTDDYFALPNTVGKRIMGTGRVDNNTGSASVEPDFGPGYEAISGTAPTTMPTASGLFQSATAGAGIDSPGSIGGVYNFTRTAQLPPGSPGDLNADGDILDPGESGTADGTINERTFTIGRFSTDGWANCENQIEVFFSGVVEYAVGDATNGISDSRVGLPEHGHRGASTGCRIDGSFNTVARASARDTVFPLYNSANGRITSGPDGVNSVGITHSHGLAWTGLTAITTGGGGSATGPGSGGTLGPGGPYTVTVDPGVSIISVNAIAGGGGGGGNDSGSPGGGGGIQSTVQASFDLGPSPSSGHVILVGVGRGGGGGGTAGGAAGGTGGASPIIPNLGYNVSGGRGGRSGPAGFSGAGGGGGGGTWVACTTYGPTNSDFVLLLIAGGSGGGGGGGLRNSLGSTAQRGANGAGGLGSSGYTPAPPPGPYTGGDGGDRSGDGAGGGGGAGGAPRGDGAPAASSDDDARGGQRAGHWVNSSIATSGTAFVMSGTGVPNATAGNGGSAEIIWAGGPATTTPGNAQLNHNTGIGNSLGTLEINRSYAMEASTGTTPSGNIIAPPGTITMSNISKTNFDNNLIFTLRNNDQIPVVSSNFRLMYLIKAF